MVSGRRSTAALGGYHRSDGGGKMDPLPGLESVGSSKAGRWQWMWGCQKSSASSMNKEFWRLPLGEWLRSLIPASVAALQSNYWPFTIKEANCKGGSYSAPATMGNVSSWSLNADIQQTAVCPSIF